MYLKVGTKQPGWIYVCVCVCVSAAIWVTSLFSLCSCAFARLSVMNKYYLCHLKMEITGLRGKTDLSSGPWAESL